MSKLVKAIKDNKLILDILNVVLGIVVVIFAVLFILHPGSRLYLSLTLLMAGLMNITNGLKNVREGKLKSGIYLIGLGAVIAAVAVLILFGMIG